GRSPLGARARAGARPPGRQPRSRGARGRRGQGPVVARLARRLLDRVRARHRLRVPDARVEARARPVGPAADPRRPLRRQGVTLGRAAHVAQRARPSPADHMSAMPPERHRGQPGTPSWFAFHPASLGWARGWECERAYHGRYGGGVSALAGGVATAPPKNTAAPIAATDRAPTPD